MIASGSSFTFHLLAAQCIQTINKMKHEVAVQRIVLRILRIIGCDGSCQVILLLQYIVYLETESGLFVFQEILGYLRVP